MTLLLFEVVTLVVRFITLLSFTTASTIPHISDTPGLEDITTVTPFNSTLGPLNRINFIDTVQQAVQNVKAKYPKAELRLVFAKGPVPTTDPLTLTDISIHFSVKGDSSYNSVSQDMTSTWGAWGPLRFSAYKIPRAYGVLPMPIVMDLVTADNLAKAAGVRTMYDRVTLEMPALEEEQFQPYYCFEIVHGTCVSGVHPLFPLLNLRLRLGVSICGLFSET